MKYKISILIILLIIITYSINHFLEENNYTPYATGTNKKAFLNSTWLMSENEVNRANNTLLKKEPDPILDGLEAFDYKISDENRFITRIQNNIQLWRSNAKVEYYFFDNKLYRYTVKIDALDNETEILDTLVKRFGEPTQIDAADEVSDKDYIWHTKDQEEIYFRILNKQDDKYLIIVEYKSFTKKIRDISKQEIKTYF